MGDSDVSEENWNQKPLPLLRVLQESNHRPIKSPGKNLSQIPSHEKENIQVLTKLKEKRLLLTTSTCKEKSVDTSEFLTPEALSSTLAVQQSNQGTPERLRPVLFSTSNISAISALVNTSQNSSTSPQERYRTPKRRDVFDPSNSSTNTPSSGSSNRQNSLRTPSSQENSGSRRATPSSSSSRGIVTPCRGMLTPGSRGSASGGSSGAWSSRSGIRYNPFECHNTADQMHLPTMSPRVFAIVQSPSSDREETTVNDQFWSIEQQAELYPVHIGDDSPRKQTIHHRNFRKETEDKTQEQIELYFSTYHDITSPPDLAPTGPLKLDPSPDRDSSYIQPDSGKASKWTQTCLTLPPTLPAPVENVLRQYGLIMNIDEEVNNLSNSTLRRKLFNADMLSDDEAAGDESSQLPSSSESEDEASNSPVAMMTPGKVMHTPVTTKSGLPSAQWSSSPLRAGGVVGAGGGFIMGGSLRHRASISPPELNSPMFSPICKNKRNDADMKKTSDCLNFEAMNSPMFSPISKNRRNSAEKKNLGEVLDFNTSRIEIGKSSETSEFSLSVNMESQSTSFQSFSAEPCSSNSTSPTTDIDDDEDSSMPGSPRVVETAEGGEPVLGASKKNEWRRQISALDNTDSMTNHSFVTVSTVSPPCSSMMSIATTIEETWGSPVGGADPMYQHYHLRDEIEVEQRDNNCVGYSIAEDSSAGGLTLPTLAEDSSNMNTESRVDTGYTTNTVSSLHPSNFQDNSSQPSSLVQDSGVSTSQPPSLTVSLILPHIHQMHRNEDINGMASCPEQSMNQEEGPQQQEVLMSYDAEGNDISVGFPLGSSTPTRK